MTKRMAKGGQATEAIKKTCAPRRFFRSGSSVFWSCVFQQFTQNSFPMPGAAEGRGAGDSALGRWKAGRRKVGGCKRVEGEGVWRERVG